LNLLFGDAILGNFCCKRW